MALKAATAMFSSRSMIASRHIDTVMSQARVSFNVSVLNRSKGSAQVMAAAAAVTSPQVRFARIDSKYDADGTLQYHAQEARNTAGKRALQPRRQYIAKRVKQSIVDSEVVVISHYNTIQSKEWVAMRTQLKEVGYSLTIAPNMVAKRVLEHTRYANMAPLFWSTTCIVSGDDMANLSAVMDILKAPKFEILGGKIGATLVTRAGLKEATELPPLEVLQAQMVGLMSSPAQDLHALLSQPGSQLHSMLGSSQSNLASLLDSHANAPSPQDE
eukprot:m.34240 g.34240  ORF g.34240 m.34240 type:complete len:271 (+) comp16952_c0_seq1:24-836(+)